MTLLYSISFCGHMHANIAFCQHSITHMYQDVYKHWGIRSSHFESQSQKCCRISTCKEMFNLGWVAGVVVVRVSDLAAGVGAVAVHLLYSHTECNNMHICANIYQSRYNIHEMVSLGTT